MLLLLVAFVVGLVVGSSRLAALARDPLGPAVGHSVVGVVTVTGNWSGTSPSHRADAGFVGEDGRHGRILLRLYARGDPPARGTRLSVTGLLTRP